MAQFDLYRLSDETLIVDLQTDLLPFYESRLVAPLRKRGDVAELSGLNPIVQFGEDVFIVRVQQMAAIAGASLHRPIGNFSHLRDEITRALDLLFHGF